MDTPLWCASSERAGRVRFSSEDSHRPMSQRVRVIGPVRCDGRPRATRSRGRGGVRGRWCPTPERCRRRAWYRHAARRSLQGRVLRAGGRRRASITQPRQAPAVGEFGTVVTAVAQANEYPGASQPRSSQASLHESSPQPRRVDYPHSHTHEQ